MRGLEKIRRIALTAVGCLTAMILYGCGSGTSAPPPVLSISFVGGSAQTIAQGQTVTITVNISGDPSGKGVTWQLSGPGTLSKQTGTSVEYDAPASIASNATATITATAAADPSKSAAFTVTVTPPPISVTVAPDTVTMGAMATQQFSATVQNDSSNKGVTWTISPASGAGTLSNATNSSVTYNAPASPPANDLAVTITAASVADPTQSNTASVTVAAIRVTIDQGNPTVMAGTTLAFTATVHYDPSNSGVIWSISPASGAGTLSNATNSSVTYNAPASPPANDLAVTITATSVADPTRSNTASVTVAAIQVTIDQGNPTAMAGTTLAFTATVHYDPSNSGVIWSISPASGAGTLSDATTSSVTYHAPPDSPASNLPVTLIATSVADHSKSGTANIIVPAISVSVSPGSALMPINDTQQFAATVHFDPKVQGASWAPIQGAAASCGPACGTFAPATTASGTATTYTAPATVPANVGVMITATSVTDTTKFGAAAITLTNGTVKLVPASLSFGSVKAGKSTSQTVSLTNTGKTTLNISNMTTTTLFSQTNDCGASVGAGVSCTVTVSFSPGGASGEITGTLTISDSSADSPQTVSLSGTGIKAHPESMASASAAERTVPTPTPTGPRDVGTRVVDLLDSTRDDSLLGDGSKRELLVRFWYPATLQQDCRPAEYTSPGVWSYFSQLAGVPLPEVRTNSCQDATIEDGAHPVVIFTPGYTATFTDYTFLFEDLASRGYVVASVDHTNEATAVEFPDGRLVESLFGSHLGTRLRTDEDAYTSAVSERLSDLKFVMTELGRLNNARKSQFAGKLDMSRVALAGHSLGGLTVLLGIEQEPRFRAGIVLDGVAPDRVVNGTEIPVFILITGRQQWSVDECRLWSNLRGPRLGVNLPGAGHLAPSDAVWLAKGMVKTGDMSPEKTVAVLRNYVAAFLDANLRGQPMNSLLTGPSAYFPDVVVTTQRQSACVEK